MELWTFSQASDKIHIKYFPRVVSNTKGYKAKEPCQDGFEQLQPLQLKERALQSSYIQTLPPETLSQSYQHALPIFMANI